MPTVWRAKDATVQCINLLCYDRKITNVTTTYSRNSLKNFIDELVMHEIS